MLLVLTRKEGESIIIGDDIVVQVVSIEDGRVKLGITAPKDVTIHRYEVYKSIQEENKKATVNKRISMGEISEVIRNGKFEKKG